MNLKTFIPIILATGAGLSALPAQNKATAVTILVLDDKGQNPTRRMGFIRATNERGLRFSYTENDPSGLDLPHSQVRAVSFTDEGDVMGPARHAYGRENYTEAEAAFRKIAEDFEFIWGISREQMGNFACEARYFQVDCLRRLGRYKEMGPALQTKTGLGLERALNEVFLPKLKLFKLWELLAADNWNGLAEALREYEDTLTPEQAKLLTGNPFKPSTPNVLVQLSYMRGKYEESQNKTEEALRDFYRCIALDYGADKSLTKDAMAAVMGIQSKDPGLKDNYYAQAELHAVAVMYRDGYAGGKIDPAFEKFTVEPEMPEAIKKQVEAQKAAAAEKEKAAAEKAAAEKAAADAKAAAPAGAPAAPKAGTTPPATPAPAAPKAGTTPATPAPAAPKPGTAPATTPPATPTPKPK